MNKERTHKDVVETDDLRARVLAATTRTPSRTRGEGRRLAAVLIAGSVAIAVTIFEAIGGIGHSLKRPMQLTLLLSGGWLVLSMALTWIVIGRPASSMARRPLVIAIATLATPILVFAWMHLFYGTYAEPPFKIGYRCFGYTLAFSALPLIAFFALRRAIEPRHPMVLGAGAGATCAAWGGALVDLWCPITDPLHVLVGHVAPIIVAIAIGALAGKMLMGFRRNETK